jgi:hypothetical protein
MQSGIIEAPNLLAELSRESSQRIKRGTQIAHESLLGVRC